MYGHFKSVECLKINPSDPRLLASGSNDFSIRLWDIKTSNFYSNHLGI